MTQPPDDGRADRPGRAAGDRARELARQARERETAERRALTDRVDELERRVHAQAIDLDVPEALASLHERLEALEDNPRTRKLREPFDWDDLDADQHAKVMGELATWIDQVLVARYPSKIGRHGIPAGWAEQPHLRDVLTAAWLAWLYAYKNPGGRLTEQWLWHRDVLAHLEAMLDGAAASSEAGEGPRPAGR